MRRGRTLIIMGLLLIILIAGGYLVYTQFLQQPAPDVGTDVVAPTQAANTVNAVRLVQSVSRGTVVDETMLGVIQIPQESEFPGMFKELGEVVGRKAKYDLDAGMLLSIQVLLDSDEVLPLAGSDWTLVIEPGKVAVSIPINKLSSVSYAPQAGDSVDVIATLLLVDIDPEFQTILPNRVVGVVSPGAGFVSGTGAGDEATASIQETETLQNLTGQVVPGGGAGVQGRTEVDPTLGVPLYVVPSEIDQRPRMVSQSVLQNVKVLRVGDFPVEDSEGNLVSTVAAEPTQPVEEEQVQTEEQIQTPEVKLPDVITLIVDPQDAITLNYLIYTGAELTLALRAAGDNSVVTTEAVTLQYLLDEYNIPVPVRLPYGVQPPVRELQAPELESEVPVPENQ